MPGVAVWTHGTGAGAEVHAAPFAASITAQPVPIYDLRANGLEVTQSVQTREAGFLGGELPSLFPAPRPGELPTRSFGNVKYRGVGLAAYSKTVVRLFADAAPVGAAKGPPVKGVAGVLRGFRNGKELPGSPLLAENGPRTLTDGGCSCATAAQRADPTASYDFTLPLSWTVSGRDKLMLRGELRQQAGILTTFATARPVRARKTASAAALAPRECATCAGNNRFTLTDIPFTPTPTVVIAPVRLFVQGDPPLPDPAGIFAPALERPPRRRALPGRALPGQSRRHDRDQLHQGQPRVREVRRERQGQLRRLQERRVPHPRVAMGPRAGRPQRHGGRRQHARARRGGPEPVQPAAGQS